VREVLLVAMLGPVIGAGAATAVALVSRVVMSVGDLLTAAVAATCTRGSAAAAARHAPPAARQDPTEGAPS
jgi:glycosyltransferase 2 family protein